MSDLGTIWAEIRIRTDRLKADLATASAQIKLTDSQLTALTSAARMNAIGTSLSSVGKKLTTYLTLPLVALAGISTKFGLDFSRGIEYANTMLKLSDSELEKFKAGVLDLSNTYGKSANDIATAAYSVSSVLHTSGEDTITILDSISKAAKAGKITAEDAGGAIVRMMSIYGIQAKDTAKLVDTLSATVYAGNANWQDLANVLPQAAGAGKALGVDIVELSGAFAALSSKTGSAEEAGTGLRAVMMALIKPSTDMQQAISDMGYSTAQEAVQDIGLVGVLKNLGEKYGTNAEVIGKLFPNVRAITGAMGLLTNNGEDLAASLEMVKNSTGETQKQIEAGTGPAEKFADMMNRLKNSGIELFSSLEPYLEKLIDFINRTTKAFNDLSPAQRDNIVKWGLIVAAVGPVLLIFGHLITAIASIKAALILLMPNLDLFIVTINAAFGPIGWLIAGTIAALGLLVIAWNRDWNQIQERTAKAERDMSDAMADFDKVSQGVDTANAEAMQKQAQYWKNYEDAANKSLDNIDKAHKTQVLKALDDANTASSAEYQYNKQLASETAKYDIDLKQRTVAINEKLTSEQIADELVKLAAARQQKERQAWLDAEQEKLFNAQTDEEIASTQQEIQKQLDDWQYQDTVDALNKRKNLLDQVAQEEADHQQKVAEAAAETLRIQTEAEQSAYQQILAAAQRKVDLRAGLESNLVEYLRNIHERELDSALRAIEQERDTKLKSIQDEMDALQKQYDDAIDKINGERDAQLGIIDERIAALQKEHEAAARAETLAGLQQAVREAQTPEELVRAQKALNKQIAEWAYQDKLDALRKEAEAVRKTAQDEADIAKQEYDDEKKKLDDELADTQKNYDDQLTATKKFYDDLMLARNLDAEAQKLLVTKTNKEILDMLEGTKADWAKLGSEIGDAFWSNLMGGITNLEELLKLLGKIPIGGGRGGGLPAFAEGGSVYGPTLALLGETATPSNPEIVIPPGGSPNRLSVVYNIYGAGDMTALRRELKLHDKELLNMMRGGKW